jgi:anaerobic magnesium-protoporphyrin IX monomethyl ester cyclase
MKVNLVIPPDPFLGDDLRNLPLGIMYIAAVTRDKGYDINVTDLRGKGNEDLIDYIDLNQDVYGFTSSTPSFCNASDLAKKIKFQNPKALTILGGIHATSLPESIEDEFDKVVVGEGEQSFLEILKDLEKGESFKRFYKSNLIKNLDSIPFPARELIPYDSAFSRNALSVDGEYAGTIITTRGCPGNCSFCGNRTMWGKGIRFRSPDNVLKEIDEMIEKYDIKHFRFQDDTMVLKKSRLKELCEKMTPLEIKWRATNRVDHTDLELLKLMKKSGCEEVGYGIESLDQEVLNKNNKKITIKQIYEAIKNTKKAGLQSRLFFIIGLPGEKSGFSRRLEEFLEKTDPEAVNIHTFVPYPGSPIFHNPDKYGIKLKPLEFEKYHMTLGLKDDELERPLTFEHDILSEEEIKEERRKCLELTSSRKIIKNF